MNLKCISQTKNDSNTKGDMPCDSIYIIFWESKRVGVENRFLVSGVWIRTGVDYKELALEKFWSDVTILYVTVIMEI